MLFFATDEKTAQHILFPLLKFIEKLRFLGRGWKSGDTDRVKVCFEEKKKQYDQLLQTIFRIHRYSSKI